MHQRTPPVYDAPMTGEYVKWNGQLAKILSESNGVATIKVIKRKHVTDVLLSHLQPCKLQPLEIVLRRERELSRTKRRAHARFA